MKELLGGLLLPFADMMFSLTNAIPLGVVRVFVFAIIAALAIWVLRMPVQLPESEDQHGFHPLKDLRFFAIGILVLQALFYVVF